MDRFLKKAGSLDLPVWKTARFCSTCGKDPFKSTETGLHFPVFLLIFLQIKGQSFEKKKSECSYTLLERAFRTIDGYCFGYKRFCDLGAGRGGALHFKKLQSLFYETEKPTSKVCLSLCVTNSSSSRILMRKKMQKEKREKSQVHRILEWLQQDMIHNVVTR